MSNRKSRNARACTVCRLRKVRCDLEVKVPCTNCEWTGLVCKLAELKRFRVHKTVRRHAAQTPFHQPNVQVNVGNLHVNVGPHPYLGYGYQGPPYPMQAPGGAYFQEETEPRGVKMEQGHFAQNERMYPDRRIEQGNFTANEMMYPDRKIEQGHSGLNERMYPDRIEGYGERFPKRTAALPGQERPPGQERLQDRPPVHEGFAFGRLSSLDRFPEAFHQDKHFDKFPPDRYPGVEKAFPDNGYQSPATPHPISHIPNQLTPLQASGQMTPNTIASSHTSPLHVIHGSPHQTSPHQMSPLSIGHKLKPGQIKDEFNAPGSFPFQPGNARANLSVVNLVPSAASLATHVKITTFHEASSCSYVGPSSCMLHFRSTMEGLDFEHADLNEGHFQKRISLSEEEAHMETLILGMRQAFSLPCKELGMALLELFFEHVYPHFPVVNQEVLMEHYDAGGARRPPLLLLNAIFAVACHSCPHPALFDELGSVNTASKIFYDRAKALYSSSVNLPYAGDDALGQLHFLLHLVVVSALALLPAFWDATCEPARDTNFWLREALSVAVGYGYHRKLERMHNILKRQFAVPEYHIDQHCFFIRKLFWVLYVRDKGLSLSYGRPCVLTYKDVDCELPTMADFAAFEPHWTGSERQMVMALGLIHRVRLLEILELCWTEQYSLQPGQRELARPDRNGATPHLVLMAEFFRQLPRQLRFDLRDPLLTSLVSSHLAMHYQVLLYHMCRLAMALALGEAKNIAWGIAFQAAYVMLLVAGHLRAEKKRDPRVMFPTFSVYLTTLAAFLLLLHVDLKSSVVLLAALRQTRECFLFISEWHKAWPGVTHLNLTYFADQLAASSTKQLNETARRVFANFNKASAASNPRSTVHINFLLNREEEQDDALEPERIRKMVLQVAPHVRTFRVDPPLRFDSTMLFVEQKRKDTYDSGYNAVGEPDDPQSIFDFEADDDSMFLNLDRNFEWSPFL